MMKLSTSTAVGIMRWREKTWRWSQDLHKIWRSCSGVNWKKWCVISTAIRYRQGNEKQQWLKGIKADRCYQKHDKSTKALCFFLRLLVFEDYSPSIPVYFFYKLWSGDHFRYRYMCLFLSYFRISYLNESYCFIFDFYFSFWKKSLLWTSQNFLTARI